MFENLILTSIALPVDIRGCRDDPSIVVDKSAAKVTVIFVGDGNDIRKLASRSHLSFNYAFVPYYKSFIPNKKLLMRSITFDVMQFLKSGLPVT